MASTTSGQTGGSDGLGGEMTVLTVQMVSPMLVEHDHTMDDDDNDGDNSAEEDPGMSMKQYYEQRIRDLERRNAAKDERIRELEVANEALRRRQVEINAAKELYLKIFEDFPALIWRSRPDRLCDYFNRTWLEWTGKTLEQEWGNGWAEGVHPDDFDRCLEVYVSKFDAREPFYMEYRLMDRHGEYRWIGDHGMPFHDLDGEFLGYIGSCYDITDNKRNEQKLVQLNATKDKFFRILAHDLRNPLAAFVSVSELLMDDELDRQDTIEIAAQLQKDSQNTLLLLENLLEWSKSQSEDISFVPRTLNLADLFREVVDQVEICAKAKNITIRCKLCECLVPDGDDDDDNDNNNNDKKNDIGPLTTVTADRNMLNFILRNLLMNAIKFTHENGEIEVKADLAGPHHVAHTHSNPYPSSRHPSNHPRGGGQRVDVANDSKDNEQHGDNLQDGQQQDAAGGGGHSADVLISVADNGVGISKEQIEDLFDLVKSGGACTSRRGTDNESGTGLGLIMCKDFVERHGGKIWVEPNDCCATNPNDTEQQQQQQEQQQSPPPSGSGDERGRRGLENASGSFRKGATFHFIIPQLNATTSTKASTTLTV